MPDSPSGERNLRQESPPPSASADPRLEPLPMRRIVALGLACGAVLCGIAAWSGGFGAVVGGDDLHGAFIARHRFIAQRYAEGHFPLWNPFELTGMPMHGASHGSGLYLPVPLVNMVADAWTALQTLYHLHVLAYVLAVLLYLSRTGLGPAAASLGAVAAASCSFTGLGMVVRDHPYFLYAMPWVVGVLLAWWSFVQGRRRSAVLVSLCCAVVVFTGYPEFNLYIPVLLGLAALVLPGMPLVRRVAIAAGLVLLGQALAAIQLVPLAELVSESARGDWLEAGRTARGWWVILSADHLVAELLRRYSGPLVWLAALGLLHRHRNRLFWSLALLWALFPVNPPFSLLYEIPPYSSTRFLAAWGLYQAMLVGFMAAAGVQGLLAKDDPQAWRKQLALSIAVAVAIGAWGTLEAGALVAVCAVCVLPPLRRRGGVAIPIGLVALHAVEIMSGIGTTGVFPPPDFKALRPRVEVLRELQGDHPGPVRFIAAAETRAGLTTPAGVFSAIGYEPSIPPRRIGRIADALALTPLTRRRTLQAHRDAWQSLAEHPGATAALGVGFVVTPLKTMEPLGNSGFEVVRRFPKGPVVLYREPAPRYGLVHAVTPSQGEEQSFALFLDAEFDPRRAVILEGDDAAVAVTPLPLGADDEVRILDQSPERVALQVRAASDGVLVAAETFFPGWVATVDGEPVEIRRANYAFRSIPIEAGEHAVEFRYRPWSFVIGCAISLVAAAILALMWLRADGTPRAAEPAG